MSETPWRPLFERDGKSAQDFDVLHEGVPVWLDQSLWRWLMDRAAEGGPDMLARLERRLRRPFTDVADRTFGVVVASPGELLDRFWGFADHDSRLTLLDAILADMFARAWDASEEGHDDYASDMGDAADHLETILASGGSAWRAHVAAPGWCLTRRVPEAMIAAVQQATAPDTDAARKLMAAWQACYRHDPDPDQAYRQAVLAVEAVVLPVTVPKSPRASLGTAAAHIRDTMDRWSVGEMDAPEIASGQVLHDMLRALWHNQERHAHPDGTIHDVSRQEAEVAVTLAVALVQWFASGLVKKSS